MNQVQPKVSVLVLNYNGKEFLKECFDSLLRQTYENFDIILVDNGSTDDSVSWTVARYPQVCIKSLGKNLGFSLAYNRVVSEVDSEYICFLNNDAKVDSGWLESLVYVMLHGEGDVIAVASRILDYDDPKLIRFDRGVILPNGVGYDVKTGGPNIVLDDAFTSYPCGAGMVISRSDFIRLKGFDERYFMFYEDVDLGWRIWLSGGKVLVSRDARLYHKSGGSLSENFIVKKVFLTQQNKFFNVLKNFSGMSIFPSIILSILYDLYVVLRYFRKRESRRAHALLCGYISILKGFGDVYRKRMGTQCFRVRSDLELRRLGVLADFKTALSIFMKTDRVA